MKKNLRCADKLSRLKYRYIPTECYTRVSTYINFNKYWTRVYLRYIVDFIRYVKHVF